MKEDWDTLIILDAYRYDFFAEQNKIEGQSQSVVSKGSHSGEFTEKNLTGRDLSDTVYVTANPNISRLEEDTFYTVENCLRRWNEEVGTVLPEDVVEMAVEAHQKYPKKRVMVHFMQPHQPYLGQMAEKIDEKLGDHGYTRASDVPSSELNNDSIRNQWEETETWVALQEGVLSKEEVQQAYRETLNIALDHVKDLLAQLEGKSVITADHGEYLGERRFPYRETKVGHPWEYTPELRIVPWLEIENGARREIVAEEPIGFERLEEETVRERLRDFGYLA